MGNDYITGFGGDSVVKAGDGDDILVQNVARCVASKKAFDKLQIRHYLGLSLNVIAAVWRGSMNRITVFNQPVFGQDYPGWMRAVFV